MLLLLFDSKGKAEDFIQVTEKFGFTESKAVLNFIVVAITSTLLKTELFKLVLLFHMKIENKSVGSFPLTMEKVSPKSWEKLKPFVESQLRNALAHGTYTVQPGKITIFKNAELSAPEEMSFGDFIIKLKTQDVLFQCLLNVLQDKGLYALP